MYSDRLSKFYDVLMGDYSSISITTQKLVAKYAVPSGDLLELGCGTGNMLKLFSEKYEIYGLDISPGMLTLAREKVPSAKLYNKDMTNFSLEKKFDVILCVFDSINHLLTFSEWERVFKNVKKHLKEGGVFIFDMNTIKRLETLSSFPPHIKKLDKSTMSCTKVLKTGEYEYFCRFQVFEDISKNEVRVFEENVREKGFPKIKIQKYLQKNFDILEMVDPIRKRVTKDTGRIFFVCKQQKFTSG